MLSDEQVAALGGGRRSFPVRDEVNAVALTLRLARMGGENLIGLARAARDQAGVTIGSESQVVIAADEEPRTVEVPEDLVAALADDEGMVDVRGAGVLASQGVRALDQRSQATRHRSQRIGKTVETLHAGQHR